MIAQGHTEPRPAPGFLDSQVREFPFFHMTLPRRSETVSLAALITDGLGGARIYLGTAGEGADPITWPKGQCLACSIPGHQLLWPGFHQPKNQVTRATRVFVPLADLHLGRDTNRGSAGWREREPRGQDGAPEADGIFRCYPLLSVHIQRPSIPAVRQGLSPPTVTIYSP